MANSNWNSYTNENPKRRAEEYTDEQKRVLNAKRKRIEDIEEAKEMGITLEEFIEGVY